MKKGVFRIAGPNDRVTWMSKSAQLADRATKSRTSIVLLISSAAAIYYYTRVYLKDVDPWWNTYIGIIGLALLGAAVYTGYFDWKNERELQELSVREKESEIEKIEVEAENLRNKQTIEEEPADNTSVVGENEPLPEPDNSDND